MAETEPVATRNADAADDPAIWASRPGSTANFDGRPVEGFIAGTDKKAGLYVYSLAGEQLQFMPQSGLNNVDLREVTIAGSPQVVLAASDRSRGGIALYLFSPRSRDRSNRVRVAGFIKSDLREPYGICMGSWDNALHAVLIGKSGAVRIYRIQPNASGITGSEVARFRLGSTAEGCAIDERGSALYLAEERKGLWRISLRDFNRALVEPAGRGRLTADVEGVALLQDADRRYLLVSSQGDSTFAIWRVDGAAPAYAGRFSIIGFKSVDEVTGTDGIEALGGAVGSRYPEGLVVVQDDVDDGGTQNFKLIDWRAIRRVLPRED